MEPDKYSGAILRTTMLSVTPEKNLQLHTHHELTLCQTFQRDGAEDTGFMAALLGYLRALPGQLPVLGGAQLGGYNLGNRAETPLSVTSTLYSP